MAALRRYAEDPNVGKAERWASLAAGSWLMVRAINPRRRAGLFSALAGMELMRRGLTGRCRVYGALNIDRANNIDVIEVTSRKAGKAAAKHAAPTN